MTENAISINIKPDAAEMIKSKMDADHQIVILALDDGSTKYSKKGGTCTIGDSFQFRSEERRVGKECRSRWSPYH